MPAGVIVGPAAARSSASVRGPSSGGGSSLHPLDGVADDRLRQRGHRLVAAVHGGVSRRVRAARCPRGGASASRSSDWPRMADGDAAAHQHDHGDHQQHDDDDDRSGHGHTLVSVGHAARRSLVAAARSRRAGALGVAEAARQMVVDQAARLHQRVADGRPDEAEAAALQRLAHRLRGRRAGRHLGERRPSGSAPGRRRRSPTGRRPGSSSSSHARALPIAAATLARLRTMPASARQRASSSGPKAATTSGSKPAKQRA